MKRLAKYKPVIYWITLKKTSNKFYNLRSNRNLSRGTFVGGQMCNGWIMSDCMLALPHYKVASSRWFIKVTDWSAGPVTYIMCCSDGILHNQTSPTPHLMSALNAGFDVLMHPVHIHATERHHRDVMVTNTKNSPVWSKMLHMKKKINPNSNPDTYKFTAGDISFILVCGCIIKQRQIRKTQFIFYFHGNSSSHDLLFQ